MTVTKRNTAGDKLAVATYEEVARAVGVTWQEVQRIERKALRKLRFRLFDVLVAEFGGDGAAAYLRVGERQARLMNQARARKVENRRRSAAGLPLLPELLCACESP